MRMKTPLGYGGRHARFVQRSHEANTRQMTQTGAEKLVLTKEYSRTWKLKETTVRQLSLVQAYRADVFYIIFFKGFYIWRSLELLGVASVFNSHEIKRHRSELQVMKIGKRIEARPWRGRLGTGKCARYNLAGHLSGWRHLLPSLVTWLQSPEHNK